MKIVHVITRLIIGGAQENTVLTCRGLVDRGHEVTLVAGPETGPEGSLWPQAEASGANLIKVDSMRRAIRPIRDWRAVRDLRRVFRDVNPDVVHSHSSKAGIIAREAARAVGETRIVHTIHGMSFNRTQSGFPRWLYRALERRAGRVTDAFVSVADAMSNQAVEAGIAPRERFTTIYSGMETDRYAPSAACRRRVRQEWGVSDGDIVIGTVARLFENKGYEEVMAAMPDVLRRVPQAKFVWVGDGAQRGVYERRLTQMGLRDRVHLTGLVPPDEVSNLMNGFDIVLHASRWEGLPRALVQGFLAEKPAVSFDNDGAPEVVFPNETGMLVPFGDSARLADAVVELALDENKRMTFGRCGRVLCLERFDWQRMVEQIEEIYQMLSLKDRSGGGTEGIADQ